GDFVNPSYVDQYPAKFMLMVLPVLPAMGRDITATVHGDTVRIQAVNPETNSRFAQLLVAFFERTGVPAVLNTSFNLRGEPIVATPRDAISTFSRSGIDVLVLGDHVISKR